jgi:hypothetical protein
MEPEKFPTDFSQVRVVLTGVDEANGALGNVDTAVHHHAIDADAVVSLADGANGFISLAHRAVPHITRYLQEQKVPAMLTGVSLAVNCAKIAMDPSLLFKVPYS